MRMADASGGWQLLQMEGTGAPCLASHLAAVRGTAATTAAQTGSNGAGGPGLRRA